jgi:hypothetical protein
MHRLRPAIRCFMAGLFLGLAGCATESPRPSLVRSIFVEEPAGLPSPELSGCSEIVHDTAVRALRSRGYVAALEPATADAWLRFTWFSRPLDAGRPEGRLTLRMTLMTRGGSLLRSVDVFAEAQSGLLTKERVADLVRAKIGAAEF